MTRLTAQVTPGVHDTGKQHLSVSNEEGVNKAGKRLRVGRRLLPGDDQRVPLISFLGVDGDSSEV